MFKRLFAFTLAELLIVVAALGFIAMAIVPTINAVRPDEELLKFKKSYYNLQRITNAVLNSENYPHGDLTNPINIGENEEIDNPGALGRKFCANFMQFLNVRSGQCVAVTVQDSDSNAVFLDETDNIGMAASYEALDRKCASIPGENDNVTQFITQDGVLWWGFGYDFNSPTIAGNPSTDADLLDNNQFRRDYSVVCIDVDGRERLDENGRRTIGRAIPFGFGVRFDGKVLVGARAQQILRNGARQTISTEEMNQILYGDEQ